MLALIRKIFSPKEPQEAPQKEPPNCQDCQFISRENPRVRYYDMCSHPLMRRSYTGCSGNDFTFLSSARSFGKCGKQGKLFNEREK